ncbi:MAG: molecular chaperone TorD family protein [Rhodocyclaceae bacterium]|nr:molecular chaperone TorD family protein [Rhodocyclaceae bacterium]
MPTRTAVEDAFRADTFALLGSLLAAPPQQALLDWLAALALDAGDGTRLTEAWRSLSAAAAGARAEALADEFQQLFIGLGKGEIVPYGSWYKTGYLMEQPLVELRADLRRLGLEADPERHEPEDHVAALCEVMSLLLRPGENYARAQQQAFFARHLKGWCARFFEDLGTCPSARFYRAVGGFGAIFIGEESLRLEA